MYESDAYHFKNQSEHNIRRDLLEFNTYSFSIISLHFSLTSAIYRQAYTQEVNNL